MSAPLRIIRQDKRVKKVARDDGQATENFKFYLDALLKMIPAEAVSLYLAGSALIPPDKVGVLVAWTAVGLIAVIAVRVVGTSDRKTNTPPDLIHVLISSIAYLIWIYSLGGPFIALGIHVPYIGSLLVLTWTFFTPLLYRGP